MPSPIASESPSGKPTESAMPSVSIIPSASLVPSVSSVPTGPPDWAQLGQSIEGTEDSERVHMNGMSRDGSTFAVAIKNHKEGHVYRLVNGVWTPKGGTFYPPAIECTSIHSGRNLHLSEDGNILFVIWNGCYLGQVFKWDEATGTWGQMGPTFTGIKEIFLSSSGLRAAVNTNTNPNTSISVYDYDDGSNTWIQVGGAISRTSAGSLKMSDDGSTISLQTTSATAVYKFNGSNWIQAGSDFAIYTQHVHFKAEHSGNGNILALGRAKNSRYDDSFPGIIHLYQYNQAGNSWSEFGSFTNPGSGRFDGHRLSFDGSRIIVRVTDRKYPNIINPDVQEIPVYDTNGGSNWSLVGSTVDGLGFDWLFDISADGKTFICTDQTSSSCSGNTGLSNCGEVRVYSLQST